MLIGFFVPLLFTQPMGGFLSPVSQWELVKSFIATCLSNYHPDRLSSLLIFNVIILAVLILPFLAALTTLVMSSRMSIVRQLHPVLVSLQRYASGMGALLEVLICLMTFTYFKAWQTTNIGPGFVLLVLGSLVLLMGEGIQNVSTSQRENITSS